MSFPIDFFEHCQVLNDLEFGGPDILHVYNAQQAKHRLMTAGMYLASTKVGAERLSLSSLHLDLFSNITKYIFS